MENKNGTRLVGMLGFAMRAGKVMIGTDTVCLGMRKRGNIKLVLLAADASDGTTKKLTFKCEYYKLNIARLDIPASELGRLLGKTYAPAVIAITDDGFAREITKAVAPTRRDGEAT